MKKHSSKEALYNRLQQLAEVKKTVSAPKLNTSGSLIDYKRAADGIAYGIIKEQHHYYIKKAGLKQNPDISDFIYIGGLENVTKFQYPSLAEADKQRNMLFNTINEAYRLKPAPNGGKKGRINEDVAKDEIDQAAAKVGDLDAATDAAATPAPEIPSTDVPIPDATGTEDTSVGDTVPADDTTDAPVDMPTDGDTTGDEPIEEPTDDTSGETLDEPATDTADTTDTGDATASPDDETNRELEKAIGKITNTIRKTEMTDPQVKGYLKSFIQAFKDKLKDIDIEERKDIANLILKTVQPEEISDLEASMPADEVQEGEMCAECGSFAKFAESRGYNADSIRECGEEEVSNLVSGYANAHNDGMNDGDLENVALVIKVVNPEILNQLKGDYGHEDYASKLQPHVDSMNESNDEDNIAKLNELFGGLSNIGKAAVGGIKAGAQNVANKVGQAATKVQQTYYAGEKDAAIKRLEKMAADLGTQVAAVNNSATKAGQQPVNVQSLLQTITSQIQRGGSPDLSKFRTAEGIDPANTEVKPEMIREEEETEVDTEEKTDTPEITTDATSTEVDVTPEVKPDINFAGAQTLGVGIVKPEGAPTTINITPDKSVSITMNESEKKVRAYIRKRLDENAGLRKPTLNENDKSDVLKRLDKIIDKQYQLFETEVVKKKSEINELFGLSIAEKFAKLDPNDANGVENLFQRAFNEILINPRMGLIKKIAIKTPTTEKYNLLKQYVEGKGGTLRTDNTGKLVYAPVSVQQASMGSAFGGAHVASGGY